MHCNWYSLANYRVSETLYVPRAMCFHANSAKSLELLCLVGIIISMRFIQHCSSTTVYIIPVFLYSVLFGAKYATGLSEVRCNHPGGRMG